MFENTNEKNLVLFSKNLKLFKKFRNYTNISPRKGKCVTDFSPAHFPPGLGVLLGSPAIISALRLSPTPLSDGEDLAVRRCFFSRHSNQLRLETFPDRQGNFEQIGRFYW